MHSAQVLEMLVQIECPRGFQVLQEMPSIQASGTGLLYNKKSVQDVSKSCKKYMYINAEYLSLLYIIIITIRVPKKGLMASQARNL